jgi:hypothetical protein
LLAHLLWLLRSTRQLSTITPEGVIVQAIRCDHCGLYVDPGEYGARTIVNVSVHFPASTGDDNVAIIAHGPNAVLNIGGDEPLRRVCAGSNLFGVVEDLAPPLQRK